jgi:hypothetical protein
LTSASGPASASGDDAASHWRAAAPSALFAIFEETLALAFATASRVMGAAFGRGESLFGAFLAAQPAAIALSEAYVFSLFFLLLFVH